MISTLLRINGLSTHSDILEIIRIFTHKKRNVWVIKSSSTEDTYPDAGKGRKEIINIAELNQGNMQKHTVPEPIIGVWRYFSNEMTPLEVLRKFDEKGNFFETTKFGTEDTLEDVGTWKKMSDNLFVVTTNSSIQRYHYIPESDIIYPDETPNHKITRLTPASSSAAVNPEPEATGSKSFTMKGFGNDVQKFILSGDGMRIFYTSQSGNGNFGVWLKDNLGNKIDLLAYDIGSYSVKKSVLMGSGTYYLDVTASGPWSITIHSKAPDQNNNSIVSNSPDAKTARTIIFFIVTIIIFIPYTMYILPYFRSSQILAACWIVLGMIISFFAYILVLSLMSRVPFFKLIRS